MRSERTVAEQRILERIAPMLALAGINNYVVDVDIVDSPDILFRHSDGTLGIEVARLDYEKYCKWLSTPPGYEYSRAAEVTINLRKLLVTIMRSKRSKYERYVLERGLTECWLVLHNNLFEFDESAEPGTPDRKWFEDHSSYELQDQRCPFDRVFFNLEHPDRWYVLFDKSHPNTRQSVITRWPSIIYREAAIKTTLGVNLIDLRDKPDKPHFQ